MRDSRSLRSSAVSSDGMGTPRKPVSKGEVGKGGVEVKWGLLCRGPSGDVSTSD